MIRVAFNLFMVCGLFGACQCLHVANAARSLWRWLCKMRFARSRLPLCWRGWVNVSDEISANLCQKCFLQKNSRYCRRNKGSGWPGTPTIFNGSEMQRLPRFYYTFFIKKYTIFKIVLNSWPCCLASLLSSQPCIFIPYTRRYVIHWKPGTIFLCHKLMNRPVALALTLYSHTAHVSVHLSLLAWYRTSLSQIKNSLFAVIKLRMVVWAAKRKHDFWNKYVQHL